MSHDRSLDPRRRDPASLIGLQRLGGNHAVRTLLETAGPDSDAIAVSPTPVGVQTEAAGAVATSALETQANRTADRIAGQYQGTDTSPRPGAASPVGGARPRIPADLPAAVKPVLGGGRPLESTVRRTMEQRFGHDFSAVRIRTDQPADRAAARVGANAFTVGNDIVFRQSRYTPGTRRGQHLLAHELTHVLQQRGGTAGLQREEQQQGLAGQGEKEVTGWFAIHVSKPMAPDELLVAFVMQYRKVSAEEAAELIRDEEWNWQGTKGRETTPEEVQRGYVVVAVEDVGLTPLDDSDREALRERFSNLSEPEKRAVTAETYRRFRARSNFAGPLDAEADADLRGYWYLLRDELLRQRATVEDLPEQISDFIFSETGRTVTPDDYPAILRIAELLASLSEDERQTYLASTTARTTDLAAFEASVARFVAKAEERRGAAIEREQSKAALFGLGEVYDRYRAYLAFQKQSERSFAADLFAPQSGMEGFAPMQEVGSSIGWSLAAGQMRDELTQQLKLHGFNSIHEFETAIRRFEAAFHAETLLVADDLLNRYEHVLWTQEERFKKTPGQQQPAVQQLHQALTPARGHYEEADRISREHGIIAWTPGEMAQMDYWAGRRQGELAAARASTQALTPDNPLFSDTDFPIEEITRANETDLGNKLRTYIGARQRDVDNARTDLKAHPEMVWGLDILLERAKQRQGIQPNSIYDKIIRDYQLDRGIEQVVKGIVVAVIAVAAGLISAGGGTVGVLAGLTAFGIGAWQAWDEFQRYERQTTAHGAQLLSDDPSFFWVVVALVGAGLDAAGVVAALRAGGGLSRAVRGFNAADGNIDDFAKQLKAVDEIDEATKAHVLRAARAEAEARQAWAVARKTYFGSAHAVIDPVVTPVIHLAVHFTYPMYLSLRQGLIGIERFLLTRRVVSLIGDYRQMNPAQLARLRGAYQLALGNAQRVAAHGHALGLLDQEIERFLLMWNRFPDMSADDMMRQLDQLAAPLQASARARSRIAPGMILDDTSRARLGNDFDQQIAGTGGIERIKVTDSPQGGLAVTIEGQVLPQRLTRDPGSVTPTRRPAPSFNDRYPIRASDLGLSGADWHRLHLWGPGFGDEAAAGMFWGPREVNLVWQNRSVEAHIRELGEMAAQRGGRVRATAKAVAWESPTPGGWVAPMGERFLKEVEYDIVLIRPGLPDQPIRVSIEVAAPPATGIRSFSIDPPSAINLGDLF